MLASCACYVCVCLLVCVCLCVFACVCDCLYLRRASRQCGGLAPWLVHSVVGPWLRYPSHGFCGWCSLPFLFIAHEDWQSCIRSDQSTINHRPSSSSNHLSAIICHFICLPKKEETTRKMASQAIDTSSYNLFKQSIRLRSSMKDIRLCCCN